MLILWYSVDFLEKQGLYCFSAKFDRSNLHRLSSFLKSGTPNVIAVTAVPSLDLSDKHYLLVTESDEETIYFLEPYQTDTIPVIISKWPDQLSLDVLFVTPHRNIAQEWGHNSFYNFVYSISCLFASTWISVGVITVFFLLVFQKYLPKTFLTLCMLLLFVRMQRHRHHICIILSLLAIFGLAYIVFNLSNGKAIHAKDLVFDPQQINLGKLPLGKKQLIKFEVKNNGIRDIKIDSMKASCSCMDLHIDHNIVPKGTSVAASAILNVTQKGKSQNQILISFEESKNIILLPITYEGYEPMKILPAAMNIGTFTIGVNESRDFDFSINDTFDFPIDNLECSVSGKEECFSVTIVSCSRDEEKINIKITITSSGEEELGIFDKFLTIRVQGEDEQVFVSKLIGQMVSEQLIP